MFDRLQGAVAAAVFCMIVFEFVPDAYTTLPAFAVFCALWTGISLFFRLRNEHGFVAQDPSYTALVAAFTATSFMFADYTKGDLESTREKLLARTVLPRPLIAQRPDHPD